MPGAVAPTAAEQKAYSCGDLTPSEVAAGQTTPTCGVVNATAAPPGADAGTATGAAVHGGGVTHLLSTIVGGFPGSRSVVPILVTAVVGAAIPAVLLRTRRSSATGAAIGAAAVLISATATTVPGATRFGIPIAVFLAMHLLITDPSTSPRTELGRIFYGILGILILVLVITHPALAFYFLASIMSGSSQGGGGGGGFGGGGGRSGGGGASGSW